MVDAAAMEPIAEPLRTIADKIRALAAAGYSRGDIASFLNRSYQQVRQVLVQDERRKLRHEKESVLAGVRETAATFRANEPPPYRIAVDEDGRVAFPAEWGIPAGQVYVARQIGDDIVLLHGPGYVAEVDGNDALGPLPVEQRYATEDLFADRRWEVAKALED